MIEGEEIKKLNKKIDDLNKIVDALKNYGTLCEILDIFKDSAENTNSINYKVQEVKDEIIAIKLKISGILNMLPNIKLSLNDASVLMKDENFVLYFEHVLSRVYSRNKEKINEKIWKVVEDKFKNYVGGKTIAIITIAAAVIGGSIVSLIKLI